MRSRLRLLRSGLVIAITITTLLTLLATGANAHAPGWVLSAEGTATVDGLLPESEWPQPAPLSFLVALPPGTGGTTAASLWAMNDETNLYIAVAVQTFSVAPIAGVAVEFDNDHDGSIFENGDDGFVFNADPLVEHFFDDFRFWCGSSFCSNEDVRDGGTSDGAGASTSNGVIRFFEMSHPLDDADNAHDFSLHAGDTVGFYLHVALCDGVGCSNTFLPGPTVGDLWGNIVIAGDTTPPELSVSVTPNLLWPPNHKYVTVEATVAATDDSDPSPTVELVSVTSNEPDNGLNDGDTANDIVINPADSHSYPDTFKLRAERAGLGTGRVYTITYIATDASGNSATQSATVTVPLER